ncbi:hypothetical protein G6F57_011690 [Rhizopus arrhizus]|nr:hypothetical protein G6F23_008923 [Rhizopus arrhizus]KAG0776858.1 hypothetical protein G6F22_012275 [Rhizopus arrhizus]KAG0781988.1 hypothetical protein G6F21_011354 [Rhizopus arrhizus]KAG0805895.1 hypothetical protein G6F20_011551 [Rhizopus arrhizus]KAG0828097.1 hypothetical protein G6F19_008417 [Rhizopus arrhizus]
MHVKVFERNSSVGGLWKYSATPPLKPKVPTDCITSEYDNLDKYFLKDPKNFAFPDFPFSEGTPAFTTHENVLAYFERYTDTFRLLPLIEFDTSVDQVIKAAEGSWELALSEYKRYPNGFIRETKWRERFDAVVAALGMHQVPFIPDLKSLAEYNKLWPKKVMHSKQVSGVDIARSLEGFAKSITISIKGPFVSLNPIDNVLRQLIPKDAAIKPVIASFSNPDRKVDSSITFEDGSVMKEVDQVIFCTGYSLSLGYMKQLVIKDNQQSTKEGLSYADVPEGHVVLGPKSPLNVYHDTFCFVSMPRFFSLSPYFDIQAKTIARVWSNNMHIPSREKNASN